MHDRRTRESISDGEADKCPIWYCYYVLYIVEEYLFLCAFNSVKFIYKNTSPTDDHASGAADAPYGFRHVVPSAASSAGVWEYPAKPTLPCVCVGVAGSHLPAPIPRAGETGSVDIGS